MSRVTYTAADGVAHVQLNRPEAANALDLDAARELIAAVDLAATDGDVRALLVSGSGPRFCAGGDVAAFASATDQAGYIHSLAVELDAACRALADIEKPVVAAVHGAVAGAGLAVMLSCDIIVSAPGTRFVFAYPGIGFTPDCGLSYLLPRAVGQTRALTFALTGRPVTADEALGWGLVSEVTSDAFPRAQQLAATLAAGPASALGNARRLLRGGWEMSREQTGMEEARTVTRMVQGKEAQHLIAKFSKR